MVAQMALVVRSEGPFSSPYEFVQLICLTVVAWFIELFRLPYAKVPAMCDWLMGTPIGKQSLA